MPNLDFAERIAAIESRLQELKSIGTPGNYGTGGILFGSTDGKAGTDTTNFVWDNTNKRLGINTNAPATSLHIVGGDIYLVDSGGDPLLLLGDSTASGAYGYVQWNSTNDEIRIGTNTSSDVITIAESGISTFANDIFIVHSGADPRVLLGDSTASGNYGYIQWNSTSDEIRIGTNTGGDVITITESLAWAAPPSYSNSWVDFGAGDEVGYRKNALGIVMLRGMMKSGTINTTAWTLPAGFRPTKRHIQAVASNTAYGTLTINTDGTVVPTSGSNVYFSLNGVSFPTV